MSLFDSILNSSANQSKSSLFSNSSKYKAAKPAWQAAQPTTKSDKPAGTKTTTETDKIVSKKAKKRKVAETAEVDPTPQPAPEQHNQQPARADTKTHQKRKAAVADEAPQAVISEKPAKKLKPQSNAQKAADSVSNQGHETLTATPETDESNAEALQRLSPEEEAAKLRRTIFVGNLPPDAKKKMIQSEFGQYGIIESIRKRSVPVKLDAKMSRKAAIITGNVSDKRGTSHAYVVFQDEAAAVAALASNMHVLDLRHIRVDRAGQSAHGSAGGSVVYERSRTVFVGNLPFDVEDEEVIVFFNDSCSKLGIADPVQAVRLVRDSASQLGKGFGFVHFRDQPAARAALGCDGQLLRKRPIRVTKAVKVPAHLKDLGRNSASKAAGSKGSTSTGVRQGKPANKAVAALKHKAEPAENWQGFKTKGLKKSTTAPVAKSTSAGHRPVEGKRKSSEKRPSVALRKQRSLDKPVVKSGR